MHGGSHAMSLSIVITTFNRAGVLCDLITHLEKQDDLDFEVMVAIDGSTDDTESRLRQLSPRFRLGWTNTHHRGYGLALARNQGIRAASGRAVVVIDDDSFPEPGFVRAHKATVAAGVITGGPRQPAEPGNERMAWKMKELARLPACTPLEIARIRREWPNAYLVENNICLLREDFIALGLFSERLRLYGFIGQEFFARAEHLGWRYQFNPEATVMHHGHLAGDNGLDAARKRRQTRWAELVRPSLMTPRHFLGQVEWARAYVDGRKIAQPGFRLHAALALPWRAARLALRRVRGVLRGWIRRT